MANSDYQNNITTLARRLKPFFPPGSGGGGGEPGDQNLQRVHLLDLSAGVSLDYNPNLTGLNSAIAAAAAGDIIWIPACTISGSITIPDQVEVRGMGAGKTIVAGQVRGGLYSVLSGVTIVRSTASGSAVYGILAPALGDLVIENGYPSPGSAFQVIDSAVRINNTGAGDAYGFSTEAGGSLYLEQVRVEAVAAEALGYAGIYTASFAMLHGSARGSTGRFVRAE
jgi:hypothetical protein